MLVLFQLLASPSRAAAVTAGIFCNGNGGNNMGSPVDASGLTTSQINGFRASGSPAINQMAIPLNPANNSVFYRLAHP